MVDKITILNNTTKQKLNFGKDETFRVLLDTDGIKWGAASASHNSYTNVNQIGATITATQVQPRTISVTGKIWAGIQKEEARYSSMSQKEFDIERERIISSLKEELSKLINPMDYVTLEVGEFFIEGKPDASVTFADKWAENNEVYCKYTFSIYCEDPLFKRKENTSTTLSGTTGMFHFPLTIKKDKGVIFGVKTNYQLIVVQNAGDVVIGGQIVLKASTGQVINPTIVNVYSGEEIKINKVLELGDTLIIDTENRDVYIERNGEKINAFVYWDYENDWIQFYVGNNLFGYSAEEESYVNLQVKVNTNEKFYSVGEQ